MTPTGNRVFPATSMPNRAWWTAPWPRPEHVLQVVGITPAMSVLDLCCGDGYFTASLAKMVQGNVIALDIDCEMIERAKVEVARASAMVSRWICADAMDLASNVIDPVDFVLIGNTFHGVPNQTGLARSIRAMLQPQGLFAAINWRPADRKQTPILGEPRGPKTEMRMSPEAVVSAIQPAGFEMINVIDLPPDLRPSIS